MCFQTILKSNADIFSIVVGMENFQMFTGLTLRISTVFTEVLEYARFCGNCVQGDPFRELVYERYKLSSIPLQKSFDRSTDVTVSHIKSTGRSFGCKLWNFHASHFSDRTRSAIVDVFRSINFQAVYNV